MIAPRATTRISASPREVITFIADPANAARRVKALEVSEPLSPGPTTTGPLAKREDAWARQAQREAEAELSAIKEAVEEVAPAR